MRAFYLAWTDEVVDLQRTVGESDRQILQRAIGETSFTSAGACNSDSVGAEHRTRNETQESAAASVVRTADDREWLVEKHAGALDRVRSVCSPRQGGYKLQECVAASSIGPRQRDCA